MSGATPDQGGWEAERERLAYAQFAGDLERRADAARKAGCGQEERDETGVGLIALGFGTLYGVAFGVAATLVAQWGWAKLAAWWGAA